MTYISVPRQNGKAVKISKGLIMDNLNGFIQAIAQEAMKQTQQSQTRETTDCLKQLIASRTIARLTKPQDLDKELQLSLDEVRRQFEKEGMVQTKETNELTGLVKNNLLESIILVSTWEME